VDEVRNADAAIDSADWARAAVDHAEHGDFCGACLLAEMVVQTEREINPYPSWRPFLDACDLAERIDCLLDTLPRWGTGAELARACRRDLATLPVLADWCEEHSRPAAAAELRHLHGLALVSLH
jgi:hypothetical protein